MPDGQKTTGKLVAELPDEPKRRVGRAILDGLTAGRFTFTNPLATEGGNYDQSGGGSYTQYGGGNHDQGVGGDYNQSKLTGNLGRLDITDLTDILRSIERFER